jgi:hypothetical protein
MICWLSSRAVVLVYTVYTRMRLLLLSHEAEWRFVGWWSPEKFKGGEMVGSRYGTAMQVLGVRGRWSEGGRVQFLYLCFVARGSF